MAITSTAIGSYFSAAQGIAAGVLGPGVAADSVALVAAMLIFAVIMSIIFSVYTYVFGWLERKLMARAQSRRGPTYVGKWGFLQNLADLIKLLTKEHIVPDTADRPVFEASIPLLLGVFILMLFFIPLTPNFIGIGTSLGLLVVFMLLSLTPTLVFIAGWTSGNKFSSIAAQRSVLMMMSYEIPLILVMVAVAFVSSSYSFSTIVSQQSGAWNIFLMPIGFVVFFVALLGELDRPPFDLREADSELIAGWLTDVSAPYYGLILFLDYVRLLVGILLITILFLGGWMGPSFLPAQAWLAAKVTILTLIIIAIRATTVRMRVDKLLSFGWKYLMPLAVINLLLTFVILIA